MSLEQEVRAEDVKVVGLLAGSGLFPICFARAARSKGLRVVAVAIRDETSQDLAREVDQIHWAGLAKLGEWIETFQKAGVRHVVMCGGVDKSKMYRGIAAMLPDARTLRLWYKRLRSKEDHTVLESVADEFARDGITLVGATVLCPELLARRGCLTKRKPTADEWKDVRFAWPLAKQIAALQIGQTIVVKDQSVVAVEGMDGTDATLRRGGQIARGDVVAVKVPKEGHDIRFDVPCIGPHTVEVMKEAGVAVLAVQAGMTILLEPEEVKSRAQKARVSLVAVTEDDVSRDEPPAAAE
jgi:DUF1009 family protein